MKSCYERCRHTRTHAVSAFKNNPVNNVIITKYFSLQLLLQSFRETISSRFSGAVNFNFIQEFAMFCSVFVVKRTSLIRSNTLKARLSASKKNI